MSPPDPAPDRRWLVSYFPAAWLGHICQGLATGVLGPSQVSSITHGHSITCIYILFSICSLCSRTWAWPWPAP